MEGITQAYTDPTSLAGRDYTRKYAVDLSKAFVTYNMFYHVEHHLFPSVPTCHLPELARRLDGAAPELQRKLVF